MPSSRDRRAAVHAGLDFHRMAHGAAVAGTGIAWRAAMTPERWQEIKRVLDVVGEAFSGSSRRPAGRGLRE
jgi:hypothetical protein